MNKGMIRNTGLLAAAIICFLISMLFEHFSFYHLVENRMVRGFQETLQDKERHTYALFDEMEEILAPLEKDSGTDPGLYFTLLHSRMKEQTEGMDLYLFILKGDTVRFWTGNGVSVESLLANETERDGLVFAGNSWLLKRERKVGDCRLVGLILIKHEYQYENRFLMNDFQADFNVPKGTLIMAGGGHTGRVIHDSWQQEAFTLDFSHIAPYSPFQSYFSLFLLFAGILLFLLYVRHLIKSIPDPLWKNTGIFMGAIIMILLNAIILKMAIPDQISDLEIFDPVLFAASNLFPTLADLLITTFFIFFLAYIFHAEFTFPDKFSRTLLQVLQGIFLMGLVFYFQLTILLFRSLVVHSSISFETYRVLDISVFTFVGLLILAFHFTSLTLLMDKFFSLFKPDLSSYRLLLCVLSFGLLAWVTGFLQPGGPDLLLAFLIMVITGVVAVIRGSRHVQFRYSAFVLLIFLYSILSVYQIGIYADEKRHDEKMVLAVDLAAEHDPVAELLLKDLEIDIATDQELGYMIHEGFVDEMAIDEYLMGNYFGGFWERYDMHFTLCSPADSLVIEPYYDVWYPCYEFFDDLHRESRIRIPGSRFYFVDNMNGRISYFAAFEYFSADSSASASLFLELDSRLVTEELGYPELLLSDRLRKGFFHRDYTYAKYNNGQLITQSGNYSYSMKLDPYSTGAGEFEYTVYDGYEHLAYHLDEMNTVVVSNPQVSLLSTAITFTYIFVFFYLILTLNLLLVNIPLLRRSFQFTIKNKIQFTMIGVLFLSLFLIGGGTILFSIRQYRERHFASLEEKIQSVYIEVMHKLEFERDLTAGWQGSGYSSLDELLQKFSNVFFSDINLYAPNGDLLATSRPEIFKKRLTGPKIHPEAYYALAILNAAEFTHEEEIGELRFLSAYVPFSNDRNELLAYLNLPYFTRQQALTREISNLVVAVVNFYVLLITISILIAVFISNQITHPLRMIESKFGKIRFGMSNEKIEYEARDEIGALVRAYNHMVDELADSAEKLARSERESAWREMAKQIAHEIKNPLTPMKLSVQHLQRSSGEEPGKREQNLKRITQTLIEQIDNLSAIATEFSNFAKMPRTINEEVDLKREIIKISKLFLSNEDIEIQTTFSKKVPAIVLADREQLSRVFINLLKNAIQAIPEDRNGKISISMETTESKAVVKVTDNGRGIPAELGDKLFQPNFTTKSSGMGMGLAIVKNIIEHAGGMIRYETLPGEWTSFIVELPLYKTV
jgi:two-component system nitrogen regulation sensor histidine kinase NtrY